MRRRVTASTTIPGNWHKFIRNDENKELFDFLTNWLEAICQDDRDTSRLFPCSHEEADTRMLLHTADAVSQGFTKLSIRTVDTVVVVLAAVQSLI